QRHRGLLRQGLEQGREVLRDAQRGPAPVSLIAMGATPPNPRSGLITMGATPPNPRSGLITMGATPPNPRSGLITMGATPPNPRSGLITMGATPPNPRSGLIASFPRLGTKRGCRLRLRLRLGWARPSGGRRAAL